LDSQSTGYGSDLWPSPDGINFQILPQHETKKQWRNHGSEKTSNHARISCACMV
jgi:hypothetical protein